jgi:hypothetical protein
VSRWFAERLKEKGEMVTGGMRAYRLRRATKRWQEGAPEYVLDCFDHK